MARDDDDDSGDHTPGARHIRAVDDERATYGFSYLLFSDHWRAVLWRILQLFEEPWVTDQVRRIVDAQRTVEQMHVRTERRQRWLDSWTARIVATATLLLAVTAAVQEIRSWFPR